MRNTQKGRYYLSEVLSYIFMPFLFLLLLAFAVFRPDDLASDYSNYQELFESYKVQGALTFDSIEPVYIILSKLIYFFHGGFLTLLLVITSISFLLKYGYAKFVFKRHSIVLLYFFLYVITFYALYELTQLRICLALSLIMFALVQRNFLSFIFLGVLAVFSHYSVVPCFIILLAIRFSLCKIKGSQVNFFITLLIMIFFACTVWFLKFLPDKYEGTNYPFYFYFFHPFSLIILLSLIFLRKIILTSFNKIAVNIYYSILLYYFLFVAFIFSGNQIPAFRFLEIALFFSFNLLFMTLVILKSKTSVILLILEVVIIIMYFYILAINPLINFDVFKNYLSLSGV